MNKQEFIDMADRILTNSIEDFQEQYGVDINIHKADDEINQLLGDGWEIKRYIPVEKLAMSELDYLVFDGQAKFRLFYNPQDDTIYITCNLEMIVNNKIEIKIFEADFNLDKTKWNVNNC